LARVAQPDAISGTEDESLIPRYKLGTAVVVLAAFATVVGEHRVAQTAPLKTVRMGIDVDMSYAS
jgi:hypothetical protein